eukprot:TRINITY_DN7194_c0_g1_i4.p1 TRINITY_DN7194_c0_g1~~TRINITY_DN7194_c0_g1_i4.p1  ORF type:complete len:258 (-),score=52.97 TRINITY_DN7194_c0_g1_i4:1020-1793(-)
MKGVSGTNEDVECIVVAILKTSTPPLGEFCAIKITKKDHTIFNIKPIDIENQTGLFGRKKIERAFQIFLNEFFSPYTFYQVTKPQFSDDLLKIEEKHPQNNKAFKVALLYSNGTERNLLDFFSHDKTMIDPKFWQFLNLLAEKVSLKGWLKYRGDLGVDVEQDSYYTVWKGIEVMFHVSPLMNSEQHRRLIGNDIVFIIFHDSCVPLDPTPLDSLGTVPQVFCVVQPLSSDSFRYRPFSFFFFLQAGIIHATKYTAL